MRGFEMRTLLASVALATASAAMAHEGHGEAPVHWHGGDLIALLAIGVAVGLWAWRRSSK
jgi:hypothetical protein